MSETIRHGPEFIDREALTVGTVLARKAIHLTGGQRANAVGGGWSLGPARGPSGLGSLKPVSLPMLHRMASQLGHRIIGEEQTTQFDTPLPVRVWMPLYGRQGSRMLPADEWGSVGVAAHRAGDHTLADLARAISTSLRAADIRVRDASDAYHHQLIAAALRGQQPDRQFRNIPLQDLYLAFHSLLSELASARDYLATFAGTLIGAPENIDALNRLQQWVKASSRTDKAAHPLVARMLAATSETAPNPWLRHITEFRNLFLHRQPLGVGDIARGLVLFEPFVGELPVPHLQLSVPTTVGSEATCDALTRFVELHEQMIGFASWAISFSKYSPEPPNFVVRTS